MQTRRATLRMHFWLRWGTLGLEYTSVGIFSTFVSLQLQCLKITKRR